jgi:stage II sporulation protein D
LVNRAYVNVVNNMISTEPKIKVGICEGYDRIRIRLNGNFDIEGLPVLGLLGLSAEGGKIRVVDESGNEILQRGNILCRPKAKANFTIYDVTIGVKFHWERKREETFWGDLNLIASDAGKITAINEIGLEDYLVSVISSEMSAAAPLEFLKAHAVISRSWLGAILDKNKRSFPLQPGLPQNGETIRWYDREDHNHFDVCADDHCQRYQGIPERLGGRAEEAVRDTRGLFLVNNNEICDARYHKVCGGLTDDFATAWEDKKVPYLSSVSDSYQNHPPLQTEAEARSWILSSPEAYCNALDGETLREVLPSFDQETGDFFRWQVEYSRAELEGILEEKTGMDLGVLYDLIPLSRGPSGRIFRLHIVGSKSSVIVGKELEIRRLLSRSHLLSSAFTVSVERETYGRPVRFILKGAGWGHGVGLCQIGAAAMAKKEFTGEEILQHYFRGASLRRLY